MIKRTAFILSLILGLACASHGQVMMLFTADSLSYITSPLAIDSLFYWFDASQGVTDSLGGAIANNEGVGTWTDLSGRGHNVTQTTDTDRPVYKATGGPASKPCIQFDGSDDYLASASHWWGSDDITVLIVMKYANATRDAFEQTINRFEASIGNYRQWGMYTRNAATSYIWWFAASIDGTGGNTKRWEKTGFAKHTDFKINSLVKSSTSGDWFQDGAEQTETLDNLSSIYDYTQKMGIGAQDVNGTPSSFLQGSISEIIVYSKALSAAERGAIETYLNKKYDLY